MFYLISIKVNLPKTIPSNSVDSNCCPIGINTNLDWAAIDACKLNFGNKCVIEWNYIGHPITYWVRKQANGVGLGSGSSPYSAALASGISKVDIWKQFVSRLAKKYPILNIMW